MCAFPGSGGENSMAVVANLLSYLTKFMLVNGRNGLDLCKPTSKSTSVWDLVVAWESHR